MLLTNKRHRYASRAPVPTGRGGEDLLLHLRRDHSRHAPHFSAGNLLIHGLCDDRNHHNLSWKACCCRESAPTTPGLHHTTIYPTTASVETTDRLTDQAADVSFLRHGRKLDLTWCPEGHCWSPWLDEDLFTAEGLRVEQKIAILSLEYAEVLGCRLDLSGDLEGLEADLIGRVFRPSDLVIEDSCLHGRIVGESPDFRFVPYNVPGYQGPWGLGPAPSQAVGTCYSLFTNLDRHEQPPAGGRGRQAERNGGAAQAGPCGPAAVPPSGEVLWEVPGPDGATYHLRGRASRTVWILFAAGFEADEVRSALAEARKDPDRFFARAAEPFHDFFRRDVPALSCSDAAVERVYAEMLAACRLSIFDVPYDPFRHPFSAVSAKTNANWHQQFFHDSIFASRAMLWLNDPERCKHDLLQMLDVQFVHSNAGFGQPYPEPEMLVPTQLSFQAIVGWEAFCRTGDRDFIRTVLHRFIGFDRRKCRPLPAGAVPLPDREDPPYSWMFPHRHYDADRDWLVSSHLSGDDTCRADLFITGTRTKFWYEPTEVIIEPADTNLYLLGNRLAMKRMAETLGEEDLRRELDDTIGQHLAAMDRLMWVEGEGRYADLRESDHLAGPVRDIGNITPALAYGLVAPERAERLIADLLDPETFWTPLPCPSCPVSHPGLNGKPGFNPTGYWRGRTWPLYLSEAVQGLYRYGRPEHAAYLLHLFLKTLGASSVPAPENFNPLDRTCPGTAWMSFCAQFLHPMLSFTTGLQMAPGDDLLFDPIALDPKWQHFHFGPFHYRPEVLLEVDWTPDTGYQVTVNGQTWRFPVPTRFTLRRQGAGYRLDDSRIVPLRFAGTPPVAIACAVQADGVARVTLTNHSGSPAQGALTHRLLVLNRGLTQLPGSTFLLAAGQTLTYAPELPAGAKKDDWLLVAMQIEGYASQVCEGLHLL